MGVISDQARSPGDVMRRLAELERAVTQLRNARVLENAAVGAGGLRVHSGGSVRIQDGGNLDVTGAATVGEGGHVASADYDGTSHGNLGSAGFFLGSDGPEQASYLALNGLDVYESLQAQIDALPAVVSDSDQATDWQATNGAAIASISIPVPEGKTRVSVMAQMSGFYQADFDVAMSDRPSFRIEIGGTQSPNLPRVPDNMDTYHLVGAFNREWSTTGTVTVQVRTITGDELSPAYPANRIYLGALAIFT